MCLLMLRKPKFAHFVVVGKQWLTVCRDQIIEYSLSMQELTVQQAYEILSWYRDAGVDIALEDEPVNRFEQFKLEKSEREATRASQVKERAQRHQAKQAEGQRALPVTARVAASSAVVPDEKIVAQAREAAAGIDSLDALRKLIENFDGCNLKKGAKHTVFADGNPQADIMLIGEAPGRDEDMHGLPFVGPSGQLLDRMLGAIGLDRQSAYISNIIPWRPPGNRAPTPQETEICKPFITRHIELVNPKVLVMLGGACAKSLLDTNEGVLRLRGKWKEYSSGTGSIDAMVMMHPSYLLRQPAQKKLAWQDLLKIREKLFG